MLATGSPPRLAKGFTCSSELQSTCCKFDLYISKIITEMLIFAFTLSYYELRNNHRKGFTMKKALTLLSIAAVLSMPIAAQAQAQAQAQPIKGGQCNEVGNNHFNCEHLGVVPSVKAIYEKGFKVVAGYIHHNVQFLIIEKQ
jgi:hypothetical protein